MAYNVTSPTGPDTRDPRTLDWPERQERAVIPFTVVDGLPMNPFIGRVPLLDGRGGLWHWGEACASDSIVTATDDAGTRHILMVERSDGHGWALPGGMLDEGEDPRTACARELGEETGLTIAADRFRMLPGRVVPDPRAGRHAWMVTVPGVIDLGAGRPDVEGLDDAADAAWIPAASFRDLRRALDSRGGIFAAHVDLLADYLA